MLQMSRTIFFDLDGTLYSYRDGHKTGLEASYNYWSEITSDTYSEFFDKYMKSRSDVKRFLKGSVSNHSRALYFQGMVESEFQKSLPYHIAVLVQRYWDNFIDEIIPFEGVLETLKELRQRGYRLGIITNMMAEVQVRKLHKLGVDQYLDAIITSEEAGQQKPHPHIYLHALNRFEGSLQPKECVMVGDNYSHDVEAAEFLGITGILATMDMEEVPEVNCPKIDEFTELMKLLDQIYAEPLDGVIKYKLLHRTVPIRLEKTDFQELIDLRDKLWQLELIGVYPDNYYMTPGVGYGNASIRYTKDGQFLVSGSQTGEKEETLPDDYALVLDYDINDNKLISKGPIKPSSESLTHAAVYEIASEIVCVIHVHHKGLWDAYNKLDMLTTPDDVLYGTPAMAKAIQDVYQQSPVLERPVAMRGHIEGLLTWGKSIQEAINLYINALSDLEILSTNAD